jgi:7,8-dihydro-6-hydroxymethylpterin-pyrophosphokinase
MHRRVFVLVPLAEIAPLAWHPVMGKSAGELLSELNPADRTAMQPIAAD